LVNPAKIRAKPALKNQKASPEGVLYVLKLSAE
jgi:hypothetical protein